MAGFFYFTFTYLQDFLQPHDFLQSHDFFTGGVTVAV